MTWYEIILLVIFGASVLLLTFRFVSKFALAARVDVANLPQEKQQSVKKDMIDQRLRRMFSDNLKVLGKYTKPLLQAVVEIVSSVYKKILEKEKQLKTQRLQSQSATEVGISSLQAKIKDLLDQAEELEHKDDLTGAEKKYIELISLDPKNSKAFEGLGDIYMLQKNYNQAKEIFNYLLKITNSDAYFFDKLGQVSQAQGRLQEAENYFSKSIGINSKNANYFCHMAEVFVQEAEYDRAGEFFARALELEPANPKYLDSMLEISIIRKDKVTAGEILSRFEKVNPDNKKLPELRQQVEQL